MAALTLPAHFDGEHILLDAPFALDPNTKLLVTVLSENDAERQEWLRFSAQQLGDAYGEEESDYSLADIKRTNPDYAGR